MITIRKSEERGHGQRDWLDSHHSFSFGEYYDPRHVQWGPLRVINEDVVAPGAGFPPHPHQDMEIVTWVLEGALAHKDSTGGASVIRPGEVQRMSAGTGIRHSEFNASPSEPVHLLQIWLHPAQRGISPGYEQKQVGGAIEGRLGLIASQDGRDGSVTIHQDADVYAARLKTGQEARLDVQPGRVQWVQVARGAVQLGSPETPDGVTLSAGDGAALSGETAIGIHATKDSEILMFDMAA